jgi:AraC-like DNA-binding protein
MPKGSQMYYMMFVHEEIRAMVGTQLVTLTPNTFVVWEPQVPLLYGRDGGEWQHSWIRISGSLMPKLISETQLPLQCAITCHDANPLDRYFNDLYTEMQAQTPDLLILYNIMSLLMRQIARQLEAKERGSNSQNAVVNVMKYMREHFTEPLTLDELAHQACLTKTYFCMLFKELAGSTPMEFLRQLRMQHASTLLADVNLPIKEVALACGYSDALYFSRLCHRYLGTSPKRYRATISESQEGSERQSAVEDFLS